MDRMSSLSKLLEKISNISSRNIKGKIECLEEVTNAQTPVRNSVGVGSIFCL